MNALVKTLPLSGSPERDSGVGTFEGQHGSRVANVLRWIASTGASVALAVGAWLLSASPAGAQNQGYSVWLHRNDGGGGWSSAGRARWQSGGFSVPQSAAYYSSAPAYGYSMSGYYSAPIGPVPGVTYIIPESNSYLTLAEVEGRRAMQIDVRVPAGATIWFDEAPTTQTGSLRRFVSPLLDPDTDYVYRVKVRWQEGGRNVTRTREVTVHAGDRLNLSFRPSAATAARR
jgi:uncharacterized protein (TIGR03000 family)